MYGRQRAVQEQAHGELPVMFGDAVSSSNAAGNRWFVSWKLCSASASCFRLFVHCIRRAASRADCTAGNNSATSTPIIAITTNSSTSVKPRFVPQVRLVILAPYVRLVQPERF